MPIELYDAPDGVHARQSFDSPSVYLDHWAIRLFSDDLSLQDRFVGTLLAKKGTLLLSNISLAEFSDLSDPRHCYQTEKFFERLLPNIYFTDLAFDKILWSEEREPDNVKRFWPPADLTQLKIFVEHASRQAPYLTMKGFVALAHLHRDEISESTRSLKKLLVGGLSASRRDPKYVASARNIAPSNKRPRTLLIFGELMRTFTLDDNAKMSENDSIDLLHAAMPVNCCDYVLLDSAWAERVQKMKLRISKTSLNMPIAACFSRRNDGVEQFLTALSNHANGISAAVPQ
jgi:hypothetical protein